MRLPDARGHEQRGACCAVVVQSDDVGVSTWLVAPTTTSDAAAAAVFRPEVRVLGTTSRVLCERTRAVDPQRLGDVVGRVRHSELVSVDPSGQRGSARANLT